jgi:hypothetical protein
VPCRYTFQQFLSGRITGAFHGCRPAAREATTHRWRLDGPPDHDIEGQWNMSAKKVWCVTEQVAAWASTSPRRPPRRATRSWQRNRRNTHTVTQALGQAEDLLVAELDITSPISAQAAVKAALDRFGRIDVLVNNAATFQAAYFEEISPELFRAQIETNLFGSLNVTRAVLPTMREQRSGHIVTITSLAGLVGQEFTVAYATSKFGLEGWMGHLDDLGGPVDRRLRRAHRPDHRRLAEHER